MLYDDVIMTWICHHVHSDGRIDKLTRSEAEELLCKMGTLPHLKSVLVFGSTSTLWGVAT